MQLNMGCGTDIKPDMVNVDFNPLKGVDIVLDLSKPWPWEPNSVSKIYAAHVLEHLPDLVDFMDKAHTALETGGILIIVVPHHRHRNADTDPTHVRRFTENSLDYFCPETAFESLSDKKWIIWSRVIKGGRHFPFARYLGGDWQYFYLVPPYEIKWVLQPIKEESV